jgi:hypothetical protein
VTVYLGLGGTMPRPGQGAIAVPPNSLMTLPVAPGDLDLGVDVNDSNLSADAVVFVLRHATVQPAFLAAVSGA